MDAQMALILSLAKAIREPLYNELHEREARGDTGPIYTLLADIHEDCEALAAAEELK